MRGMAGSSAIAAMVPTWLGKVTKTIMGAAADNDASTVLGKPLAQPRRDAMADKTRTEALARMAKRLSARPLVGFVQATPDDAARRASALKQGLTKKGFNKV